MRSSFARFSRPGQLKIQEMAFTLMAIIIFFALVGIFFLSVKGSQLKEQAIMQNDEQARILVGKLSGLPELALTSFPCRVCIDMDKAMALVMRAEYKDFWQMDYLAITTLHPRKTGDCLPSTYPSCERLVLVNKNNESGVMQSAFAAICRKDKEGNEPFTRCELGKIVAAGRSVK